MVIERKFIEGKLRERAVMEYLEHFLDRVGFSHIDIQKTPVGFSVIIYSSKPGLIVGRGGLNIREIQTTLKKKFHLESPVVEVREVEAPELDPQIMAERIGTQLTKFGAARFKAIGHKALEKIMAAGAIGAEIKVSGKVPSSRARAWKFYAGYLPKCGSVAIEEVKKGHKDVQLKPGVVGVTVKILRPGVRMPDHVYIKEEVTVVEEPAEEKPKKEPKKRQPKKKSESKKREPKGKAVKQKKEEIKKESEEEIPSEAVEKETVPETTEEIPEEIKEE